MKQKSNSTKQQGTKMAVPAALANPDNYIVGVKGWCLYPVLEDGDFAIIAPNASPMDHDLVHVISDGMVMLQRYRYDKGREWFEADWPQHIEIDEAQVLGVVVAYTRLMERGSARSIPILGTLKC